MLFVATEWFCFLNIMFRKLRQKLKPDVAPRKVRVRGVLELLEKRAMLSAHGLTNFGQGGHDSRPRMEAGSRFNDSTAFASQPQQSMSYETQTFSSGRELGGPHGELRYRPPMQMAFQPISRTRPIEQHPFQNPSWNQPFADPLPTFNFFEEAPHFEPPIADSHGALPRVVSKSPSTIVPPGDIQCLQQAVGKRPFSGFTAATRPSAKHNPVQCRRIDDRSYIFGRADRVADSLPRHNDCRGPHHGGSGSRIPRILIDTIPG
jgi:hypothetical protein